MTKTKVLIFIDWFLPAYKAGGPVRSIANLTEHLHTEIDFYIVCGNQEYNENNTLSVSSDTWLEKYHCHIIYLSKASRTIKKYQQLIQEIAPDKIYINGIFSGDFSVKPLLATKQLHLDNKCIVASRGMLAPAALGIKKWKKLAYLQWAKWKKLYKNVQFHATDILEKQHILTVLGKEKEVRVIANLPRIFSISESIAGIKEPGILKLVYVGRISPEKNCKFQLECLKEVQGNIQLNWVGSVNDETYYKECLELAKQIPQLELKHLTGIHPDKIQEILAGNHVFFHPALGENFGHSILEAMQCGIPVLISDKTPWKELEKKNLGWDIPLNKILFKEKLAELVDAVTLSSTIFHPDILEDKKKYRELF